MLDEKKRYFDHKYLENNLLFMRTHEHFLTHDWLHKEFYTCYYVQKEESTFYVGSISIFHALPDDPSFQFASINSDFEINYKNIYQTPDWFQELAQKVKDEHLTLMFKAFPLSKYKDREDVYKSLEQLKQEKVSLEDDSSFIYEATSILKENNLF